MHAIELNATIQIIAIFPTWRRMCRYTCILLATLGALDILFEIEKSQCDRVIESWTERKQFIYQIRIKWMDFIIWRSRVDPT